MARAVTRLHTLTALGLGAYLVAHLVGVWPVVGGRDGWIAAVASRGSGHALGMAVVGLLIAHAALGVVRAGRGGDAPALPGGRPMARLQLVTGVVVAIFVAAHLLQLGWLGEGPHRGAAHGYAAMRAGLSMPAALAGYLVGITAAVFHATHGVSRLPFAWGVGQSPRSVRLVRVVAGVAGALLWLGWLEVVSHLAIGTGLVDRGR